MRTNIASLGVSIAIGALPFASLGAEPALGKPAETVTNATVTLSGGGASALGACLADAKGKAKKKQAGRVTGCQNAPVAAGGGLLLNNVAVATVQPTDTQGKAKGPKKTYYNITLNISGGDASAVATCASTAAAGDATMVTSCENTPTAVGGDVVLSNVTIVIQPAGNARLTR